jgi:flagellar basal body-associated protein FliL
MKSTFGSIELAGRVKPGGLYSLPGRKNLVSIAIVSLLVLVIVVIVAIPILIRVFGEAVRRNPNRHEDEGDESSEE